MSVIIAEELKAGVIFGDINAGEYVYMPGGEVGSEEPICIFETTKLREDISLERAVNLVLRLSLKQVNHPLWGIRAY